LGISLQKDTNLTACQSHFFSLQSIGVTQTVVVRDVPQDLFPRLKLALENGCHIVYANNELRIAVTWCRCFCISLFLPLLL